MSLIPITDTKTLRLPQIVALYIGSALGCGILILPGLAAELAGPASLISWVLMSIFVLPMALTMGLLSMKFPDDGGVSHFVGLAFNPLIGSLIGWFFLLSVVMGAPILSLTGAGYLCAALGMNSGWQVAIAAALLIAAIGMNYFGMRITGQIQIIVVFTTICILIAAFLGSIKAIDPAHFTPFMPYGLSGIGHATTLVFWCFIGWEAVAHISEEFEDPKRDVIRATIIAAGIISTLYLVTAYAVIGTHSYGTGTSDVALLSLIRISFGTYGSLIAGVSAFFISIAPCIAYIGAASRLASSLAMNGYAPGILARLSTKYYTPVGGLGFLACCYGIQLLLFITGLFSLTMLIQVPNATFILTYLGGCAAGIVLLKEVPYGRILSMISLMLTGIILLFVSWAILYPCLITFCWIIYVHRSGKLTHVLRIS